MKLPVMLYSRGFGHKMGLPTWLSGFYELESSNLREFKEKVKEFVKFEQGVGGCCKISEPDLKEF